MKRNLLSLIILLSLFSIRNVTAQRYVGEVYSSVNVTPNIVYGHNYSVLTGTPRDTSLYMDFYAPAGDTLTRHPLVIVLHTGSFLPIYINQTPSGSFRDSTVVEVCKQYARRGYVAAHWYKHPEPGEQSVHNK